MIQIWRHKTETMIISAAQKNVQVSRSLSAGLCADFDNPNYQPTLGGADRLEKEI